MGGKEDEKELFFQATRLMFSPSRMKRCSGEFAPIMDRQYLLSLRLSTCRVTSDLMRDRVPVDRDCGLKTSVEKRVGKETWWWEDEGKETEKRS